MKKLSLLFLTFYFFHSFGQTEEKINIPKGIVYKYCDKATVDSAKNMIKNSIRDSSNVSLLDNFLIVGPTLWTRFKNIEILKNIEGGNTTFHVDKNVLTGKMTQDIKDTKKVWSEFRKEINGKRFEIRKLNEMELIYYWSIISFDIDEPLLIVETNEHKYILNILKKDMKLMWLDEAPQ